MLASHSFLCLAAFLIATIGPIRAGDGVLSSLCSLHHTASSNRQCDTEFPGNLHRSTSVKFFGCRL